MRLELDNVVVETEDPIKINRYIELGYKKIGADGEAEQEVSFEDLSKDELIALAKLKGLEFVEVPPEEKLVEMNENPEITTGEELIEKQEADVDYFAMNKDDIMAELDKKGIKYNKRATKDELIAILESDE